MRSLFLKILLWFGLAMVLVNVVSFVTGVIIERRSQPLRDNPAAPMYGIYAETAAEIFERDRQGALSSVCEIMGRACRKRLSKESSTHFIESKMRVIARRAELV